MGFNASAFLFFTGCTVCNHFVLQLLGSTRRGGILDSDWLYRICRSGKILFTLYSTRTRVGATST